MADQKKPKSKGKLADVKRRLSEEVKKQKLSSLESEQSARDLAEDEARLQQEEIEANKTPAERELDEALAQSAVQEKKKKLRKQQIKQASMAGGALFFIYVVYLLFVPFKGTMDFGICKVFLELQVQYPDELRLNGAEEYDNRTRIWYRTVGAFGEHRLARMECNYKRDEKMGRILDTVLIDREQVDPAIVAAFNRSIPAIRAHPPDLTYPAAPPDALADLQFNIDAFRKPIFGVQKSR